MGLKEGERADLVVHLEELRQRILRSAVYLAVLMIGGWAFYDPILGLLLRPVQASIERAGGIMQFTGPMEAFWTRFQVSVVVALIAGAPLLFLEAWGFVAPGLTGGERRAVRPLVPVSAALAAGGVALCYAISPRFFNVMLGFAPPGVKANLRLNETVMFLAKFYLSFAAAFQLPLVIVGLVRAGVLSSETLTRRWREAVVIILIVAAIITPSPDAFTLALLAVPLLLLFMGTLWAVKIMERRRRREEAGEYEDLESD